MWLGTALAPSHSVGSPLTGTPRRVTVMPPSSRSWVVFSLLMKTTCLICRLGCPAFVGMGLLASVAAGIGTKPLLASTR